MENPVALEEISVQMLKGVGPHMEEKLAKCGVATIQDLLFHLPLRYQDRTKITPIAALRPGSEGLIEGEIVNTQVEYGKRRSLACSLQDHSGCITLRFYYFSAAQMQNLSVGRRLCCFGEVRRGSSGLELYHPEYSNNSIEKTLTAIYPSSQGLSQFAWRKLILQAIALLDQGTLTERIPPDSLGGSSITLEAALRYLHQPPTDAPLDTLRAGRHPCQQRLAFEELLAHHLSLLKIRQNIRQQCAPVFNPACRLIDQLRLSLDFVLTAAQERVWVEISADLQQTQPMLRLLQGDVGAGKTIIAALAALQAIHNGFQVVIMAPTEILAAQHLQAFQRWFTPLNIDIAYLTGHQKGKKRGATLAAIAKAHCQLILGTHALFQSDVVYQRLGLIVIDEQHRFGVSQRLALREKALSCGNRHYPHQLVMTATPIPRTLAMSVYADLDVSVIDELPPGRKTITTALIDNNRREQVIERVRLAGLNGRQIYWVCTLIDESESLQCQAAEVTAKSLREQLPELRIGLVHGRLTSAEKSQVMQAFKTAQIDLLVATTVIEVGVNVPNASLMIIENPERLGLAQLHQLRGRVGRSAISSHCVLLYNAPLGEDSKQRLQVMRETNDGFLIAEKDLQLRGPGEVLGTRQTGLVQFKIADLQRDAHLLRPIQETARSMMQEYTHHVSPLIRRWLMDNEAYVNA